MNVDPNSTARRHEATPGQSETDVLVVGAGPTGLTMACELLRRGIRCRLIDKAGAPGTTSRAMGIQARTLEVFDDMGIVERVLSEGVPGVGVRIHEGNNLLLHMNFRFMASDEIPYPYGVMLPQDITEQLLTELLHQKGGTVERLREVTDVRQEGEAVIATVDNLRDGTREEIRAGWMVGCDGAHSRVRKALGLSFEGSTYNEEYLLGDVDLDWDRSPDSVYVWMHPDGQFAAFPLPGGHWRLLATSTSTSGSEDAPRASPELFQRVMKERTGDGTTRISNPIWMSNFKINRRMVSSYRKGRVFLVGDAAHVHSPFGGQGMNTGIQDAYNLGWKLALVVRGKAADSLLDTYQAERMPIARQVLHETHRHTSIFFPRNRAVRFVRDRIVIPLLRRDLFQRRMLWRASELGINYRDSTLSRPGKETLAEKLKGLATLRKAPQAGDRAPDGYCSRFPSRSATSLFHELRGTGFTLLLFGGRSPTAGRYADLARIAGNVEGLLGEAAKTFVVVYGDDKPEGLDWYGPVLLDTTGELHRTYGAEAGALYLIRPDGYVGFRGWPTHEEQLLRYLGDMFLLDGVHAPRATQSHT